MSGPPGGPGLDPVAYRVVDAFTDAPFSGNPAAVVLPGPWSDRVLADTALLQAVAAEMNLSETAFPHPPDDAGVRRLRWFTPTTEVTLCGHATLAAAHVLLEEGAAPAIRFTSLSGVLSVNREEDGRLRLDFPADPPEPAEMPAGLAEALGIPLDTQFLVGDRCAVLPLSGEEAVRGLDPDQAALGRVRLPRGVMGVSVTARALDQGVHFVSRFFGPWVGVPEDPVTGMAHTVLGPYWARRLERFELEARQLSRRGGGLRVRLVDDRVHLIGRAVTVARGDLLLPSVTPFRTGR